MWKVTEPNQRKFNSLFAMKLNLYCWRLVLYSLDSNADRGLRMGIPKTISHGLDHHDRHGHRDRVLSLRARQSSLAAWLKIAEHCSPAVMVGGGAKIPVWECL